MAVTIDDYLGIADLAGARSFIVKFVKERLRGGPFEFGQHYGYTFYIEGLRAHVSDRVAYQYHGTPNPADDAISRTAQIAVMLLDAAWTLACEGHLRPGPELANGQGPGGGTGYSVTESGRAWFVQQPD